MPKRRALMLHSENSAVGLYRIWRPAKWLERNGWEIVRLPDAIPAKIPIDHKDHADYDYCWECLMDGIDLIVMQRADNPDVLALVMAMADLQQCPIIYDIDDDIYDIGPSSPAYEFFYPGSPLFEVVETMMRNVHALTVSTPALKERYKEFNPNIFVLPNAQDTEYWNGLQTSPDPAYVTIGWAGGHHHYDDLHMLRRPLKKLMRNYPNVRLKLNGLRPDFLENHPQVIIETEFVHCNDYPKKLQEMGFDIGLAPVVDRPFNRGKSNIKWQEYSMAGIPTIASKVGEYKEIQHEVTGLLADSEDSWYFWMEKLVKDAELRKTLAKNAKEYVETNCNITERVKDYDAVYKEVMGDFTPLSS